MTAIVHGASAERTVTGMSIRDDRMNVAVPGRCTLSEVVRGKTKDPANDRRRCIFCKYQTTKMTNKKCFECLDTEHLDGFRVDPVIAEDKRHPELYEWIMTGL